MKIGPIPSGLWRCSECNSKGPGLRTLVLRFLPMEITICPGCAPTLQHVLKNEFSRPHMKERKRG